MHSSAVPASPVARATSALQRQDARLAGVEGHERLGELPGARQVAAGHAPAGHGDVGQSRPPPRRRSGCRRGEAWTGRRPRGPRPPAPCGCASRRCRRSSGRAAPGDPVASARMMYSKAISSSPTLSATIARFQRRKPDSSPSPPGLLQDPLVDLHRLRGVPGLGRPRTHGASPRTASRAARHSISCCSYALIVRRGRTQLAPGLGHGCVRQACDARWTPQPGGVPAWPRSGST